MAWTRAEHHVFSDRWRVSSLIWAFVELILGLVVLLCALISIATIKIIRTSGLCLSCHTFDIDRGKEAKGFPKAEFLQNPQNKLVSEHGSSSRQSEMKICEQCTLLLNHCLCSANKTSSPNSPSKTPCKSPVPVIVNSTSFEHSSSTLWNEDDSSSCQRVDSLSFEIIDDPSCGKGRVEDVSMSAIPYGSECRQCAEAMSELSSLSGRPLKRKYAKVFPDSSRGGSSRDLSQESVIAKKTPAGIHLIDRGEGSLNLFQEEIVVDDDCEDADQLSSMPKQFVVSDSEDAENLRKPSWEESSGNSSQDSFTYMRRFPVNCERSVEASGASEAEGVSSVSLDTEFGRSAGGITSGWTGNFAGHSDEMEGESAMSVNEDDDMEYSGVKELKEALRAERKALADLYNELEEERNAAATAANEAMAMISRLQEEKAAAQMESRQYQRMVEEKQQYDQEAIALLQDILVRRDQEMYNLEEEAKLYRERLLAVTMDELVDRNGVDRSGSPRKTSDYLVIERETLLLEGNDDWKNHKKDTREERLLAEIKDWVTAANQRLVAKVPERALVKADEESTDNSILSRKISNLSIDSGRRNLLESFTSVGGDEENGKDGRAIATLAGSHETSARAMATLAGRDEASARNEDAVGYESFHCMMDSLRKEPRLRDEASLDTLNKIEEKFQKQSRKGKVRNEDDLRRIWKNTLRSFGPAAGENAARSLLSKQDSKGEQTQNLSLKRTMDESGLMSGIVRDAEANRAMEQKKISVLEYVWKFEEQLHQGGKKKPANNLGRATSSSDINKSSSSTSESGIDDQSGIKGALMDFPGTESDREKTKRPLGDGKIQPLASRFRKLASEGDRLAVRREVGSPPRNAADSQEQRSERLFRHEEYDPSEGFLVHDVYEVQGDSLDTSTSKRGESVYNDDLRKSVLSTGKKLAREEFTGSPRSDVYMEFLGDNGDRLGKPDPLPGYSPRERKANFKGRPYSQTGSGRYVLSLPEEESCEQEYEWPATSTSGRDHNMSQISGGRTSETPSPTLKMGDVVDQLTVRLKTLEADRQTMQQTISSLRNENGEMKLLQEIAQQLRELRGIDQKPVNSTGLQEPSLASSIKTSTVVSKKRRAWSLPWRSTRRTLSSSSNLASTIHTRDARSGIKS